RAIERLHQCRQQLRYPEADIGNSDFAGARMGFHQYLVLLAPLGQRPQSEAVDDAEILQPAGDELIERLLTLLRATTDQPTLSTCRKDCVDGALALVADTFRGFA